MRLSLLEIRRKPSLILDAVEHNEDVIVSSRGNDVARITSLEEECNTHAAESHPAYGMWADKEEPSAEEVVRTLRKSRYHDL